MKNLCFRSRFGFAWNGLRSAWAGEASFRTQAFIAVAAVVFLLLIRPAPIWWAIFLLTIASVLAAELINTALESVVDLLHPEHHPLVGRAKDCAAAAVLVLSLASLAVAALMLWEWFSTLSKTSGV